MPRDNGRDLRDRALEELQDDGIPAKEDIVAEKIQELRRADQKRENDQQED